MFQGNLSHFILLSILLIIRVELMENSQQSWLHRVIERIVSIINLNNYTKIVLQLPPDKISLSFDLTQMIKSANPLASIFILFDTMKKSCCVDILGADHVAYDCLIHFGKACFSSVHRKNHYFIFDQPEVGSIERLSLFLNDQKLGQKLAAQNIGYLLVEQQIYEQAKRMLESSDLKNTLQILKLPFDAKEEDQYLIFGYHFPKIEKAIQNSLRNNLLILATTQQKSQFAQNILFSLTSIHTENKIGKDAYIKYLNSPNSIEKVSSNNNKRLMQRFSLISQVQENEVFGIVISNISTSFYEQSLNKVKQILKANNKKYFTFMMNNLNQVKLGNFPEIQVYIIVSCFNNSLFSMKEFHRVVVTPIDIQIAFGLKEFSNYSFDLNQTVGEKINLQEKEQENGQQHEMIEKHLDTYKTSTDVVVLGKREIQVQNKMQTLDFYQQREYRGLQYTEKKEIKKIAKGKIGLAEKYRPIQ